MTSRARGCSPTRSTVRSAGCSRRTARRGGRWASSTTEAATSTWRSTGPQALAEQDEDPDLGNRFSELAQRLAENQETIVEELSSVQGSPVEIDGYYRPDDDKVAAAMRPSATLNDALEALAAYATNDR